MFFIGSFFFSERLSEVSTDKSIGLDISSSFGSIFFSGFAFFVAGLGLVAYNEGYTNGERAGQLLTAQYVAQKCHEGGKLMLFGNKYYCGRIEML